MPRAFCHQCHRQYHFESHRGERLANQLSPCCGTRGEPSRRVRDDAGLWQDMPLCQAQAPEAQGRREEDYHMKNSLSKAQCEAFRVRAGSHAALSSNDPPDDERGRILYGMLEAIDYECWKYGDAPPGTSLAQVKAYLKAHKAEVLKIPFPSSLGKATGAFAFLGIKPGTEAVAGLFEGLDLVGRR